MAIIPAMSTKVKFPLVEAIRLLGGPTKTAMLLGCSRQNIHQMSTNLGVSKKHALRIEELTGGVVDRHDLRPDIFGRRDDNDPQPSVEDELEKILSESRKRDNAA